MGGVLIDELDEIATGDGRRARRTRNRDAVVEALLGLYEVGNLEPSAVEIAAAAGLSPRSLFRYFDDVDDLCRAAVTRRLELVAELLDRRIDPSGRAVSRITDVVDARIELFDAMGPAAVVARLRAPFQPELAAQLAEVRRTLRRQMRHALRPELEALGERAAATLAMLDVLCSFEAYQLLRHDQKFGRTRARAALVDAVTTQLGVRRSAR